MSIKAARYLFERGNSTALATGLLLCVICSLCQPSAQAQSTDQFNPESLIDSQAEGELEPSGQNYYYSFEEGPGNVKLQINGSSNYSSSNIQCAVTDDSGRELANFVLAANGTDTQKAQVLHLQKRQHLTLKLQFGVDVGLKVKYKVLVASTQQRTDMKIASANLSATGSDAKGPAPAIAALSSISEASVQASENVPVEDKFALVIGVSKFKNPKYNLKYSSKDAQDLAKYLVEEAHFAKDHVRLLIDEQATKEKVLEEIGDKWLPRIAHPNDLVLIFVSSHGSPSQMDVEGMNYLVLHDTDPDSLYATGLPLQDLAAAIKQRVHANRVVVIIDACHSGAANTADSGKGLSRVGNFDSKSLAQGTGQLVICSSAPNQVSWESKRYANGVFTHQLIEGLRSSTGRATLGQAFNLMKTSVLDEVLADRKEVQTPIMKSVWKGDDLILSAPASRPHSATPLSAPD